MVEPRDGLALGHAGRKSRRSAFAIIATLALSLTGLLAPARTAWASCVSSGTDEYTCSGEFSGGLIVQDNISSSDNTTTTVKVNSLTANAPYITWVPSATNGVDNVMTVTTGSYSVGNSEASLSAVNMSINNAGSNGAAQQLTINGTFFTAGVTSTVIGISTSGAAGNDGSSSSTEDGGAGGGGGGGGSSYLTSQGSVTASGSGSIAVFASSGSGNGGKGGSSSDLAGGNGGAGGDASFVQVTSASAGTTVSALGTGAPAVVVSVTSGNGGDGASGATEGGRGGAGGNSPGAADASSVGLIFGESGGQWNVTTSGTGGIGIELTTTGGNGGNGAHSTLGDGGGAGAGGTGGDILVESFQRNITTAGSQAPAFFLQSVAGQGGNGGAGESLGDGGSGGAGGPGGNIKLSGNTVTQTSGTQSAGVAVYSLGGAGGQGGDGGWFDGGGSGGSSGAAGTLNINIGNTNSSITTTGGESPGVIGQSIGGHAGSSGSSTGIVAFSASGGSAGAGGTASVSNGATITTTGDQSPAIAIHSIGGGGGNGGSAFGLYYSSSNDSTAQGGAGGTANVSNGGALTTSGNDAPGIQAESIGGTGGNGGDDGSLIVSFGGGASNGADGGAVTVTNKATIITGAPVSGGPASGPDPVCGTGCSHGISAQSIGGGGGNAGATVGWFSIGGAGGGGGDGGTVTVTNNGASITTNLVESDGILAQSIGGGGGRGSGTISLGAAIAMALGGSGGDGGSGGEVNVTSQDGSQIATAGDNSPGIHAQSVGGGGGNATYSAAASVDVEIPSIAVAVGGSGGSGGDAGSLLVTTIDSSYTGTTPNKITTTGSNSPGILGQSIGGGGGNGAFAIGITASGGEGSAGISIALGGAGGSGGTGAGVEILSDAQVQTAGSLSPGLVAQSIGGGGGNAGAAFSGNVSAGSGALAFSLGGSGGDGGDGQSVQVGTQSPGSIVTAGAQSPGIIAQSIGGGGGTGGLSIAGNLTLSSESKGFEAAIGGSGGSGGTSVTGTSQPTVLVTSGTAITTSGSDSQGILAQSIGGGGGSGGASISASLDTASSTEFNLSVGGFGGDGGDGGNLSVSSTAPITTSGAQSEGILAQSIGGGGGSGGLAVSGTATLADTTTFSLTIGGFGGGAGTANTVAVSNSSSITTTGTLSDAILAQSIGGSGGRGGNTYEITPNPNNSDTTSYEIAIGGSGGSGRTGGTVTLSNSGTILATGLGSDGIMGQSIGGGGGKGATNVELDFSPTSIDLTEIGSYELAVGGSGGSGADAGSVTLSSNTGAITTGSGVATQVLGSTYHGHGIFLQSVGGGGGDAGAASTTGFAIDGGVGLTISVGGSSGETGNGGAVSVTNSAAITTTNYNSHGIFAQSVGGGGGSGATGITDAFDIGSSKGLSFGVGGAGGSGGTVTVTNNAGGNIVVEGDNSIGIYAQSIGGGGGVGQTAIGGSVSVTSSPVSPDLATTVGGATGDGGAGGTVTVSNAATIQTGINASSLGAEMDGILAQSIGGGGGGASLAVGGSVSNSVGLGLGVSTSVGGTGGSGGAGGQVSVTNSGSVATLGDASAGIFAQSVGGGGGNAVSYVGGTVSSSATTVVELSLGNSGGSGGNGGSVNLTNSGQVVTGSSATASSLTVRDAPALFAQSVGGGGGTAEIAGALQFGSGTGIALQLGAQSGSGSGGTVQASNSNALATFNNSSHGIFAQSVGGGGGSASSLAGMGSATSWSAAISLGASGGSGNGGAVTISNTASAATITTFGAASFALYGQSVGGGGGDAGDATAASQSTISSESTANAALTLKLGASNGASGNGGAVTINQENGALATGGIGSAAIFAQSIGGGGGRAGAGSIGASGSIVVGGNSKASGDGGAVTANATGGSILAGANQASFTGVTGAYGIFAQSVGGGGGIAGNVLMGPSTNFGSGLLMGADTTASGNGGAVSVAITAGVSVTTFGNSSVGIFAQSVGGGGGVLGSTAASPAGALIGSGGGSGVAGPVSVFVGGNVTTSGDSAHGVFAQAAGGSSGSSSTPANVLIALGDNLAINVSGAGANGIYAQSSGAGMGSVSVTTGQGSTVQGGAPAVQSGEYDGAGVFINQGTSSTITNAGTIDSVSGSSGVAIRGVDTTLTITNTGTITGQVIGGTVSTGDSQITLDNEVGGTVNAGSRIEANLANSGLLTIQGPSAFNQTLITGNLTQSSTGHLLVNVDFDKKDADLFSVGGTASLGGHVVVNSLSTLPQRSVPVLSAGDSLSQEGIVADPSTLFGYGLTQTSNELFVSVTSANFSPSSIGLSRAEQAVANGLQSVWNAGGNSAFGPLFAQLDADAGSSGSAYAHDLDQLSPGASPAIAARQPAESQNFANAMLSCPEFSGPTALVTEGGCAWVRIIGRVTNQHASDGIPSFNISNITYQIGGQAQFAPNWFAAGSLAFQSTNLNGSNSTSGSGQSGYGGAAVKWQPGAFYMAFAVSGSYGQYDTSRTVSLPSFTGIASASPVVESIDARVRAAYNFVFDTWYARPYVDLDLIHTRAPGYNESGPTTVSLNVATANQTTFVGTPAVEVGKRIDLQGGMTLRPFAMAGVSVFSNSDWKMQAAFSGAPIGTLPFTTTISEGNVVGRFGAGVQLLGYGNLDLRLQYDGEYGGNRISNAGFLTAAWRF